MLLVPASKASDQHTLDVFAILQQMSAIYVIYVGGLIFHNPHRVEHHVMEPCLNMAATAGIMQQCSITLTQEASKGDKDII